jgi:hypothetical protein
MSENRKMRFEEVRSMETRAAERNLDEARRYISMSYRSPMEIDPSIVPAGYRYKWARLALFKTGEFEDSSNIAVSMNKGWTPVPVERHPELRSFDFLGRTAEINGYIHRGNSLLMERPIELDKDEWAEINNRNYNQTASIASYHSGNPHFQPQILQNDMRVGL